MIKWIKIGIIAFFAGLIIIGIFAGDLLSIRIESSTL